MARDRIHENRGIWTEVEIRTRNCRRLLQGQAESDVNLVRSRGSLFQVAEACGGPRKVLKYLERAGRMRSVAQIGAFQSRLKIPAVRILFFTPRLDRLRKSVGPKDLYCYVVYFRCHPACGRPCHLRM